MLDSQVDSEAKRNEKIVLFGQYKTGTTALFYKIKNSLPDTTRYLFESPAYNAENDDKYRSVLAKVILGDPEKIQYESFYNFDKKIYLTRDPRDWVVSSLLFLIQELPGIYENQKYLGQIMGLLKRKERLPKSISVIELLIFILQASEKNNSLKEVAAWITWLHQWLFEFEGQLSNYHLIKYEDIVDNKFLKLEKYLGYELHGKAVVESIHNHVPRTKSYGNWRDWFLQEDINFFRPLFSRYLHRYNYPLEWNLQKHPIICPDHCTTYVEKIIQRRVTSSGKQKLMKRSL